MGGPAALRAGPEHAADHRGTRHRPVAPRRFAPTPPHRVGTWSSTDRGTRGREAALALFRLSVVRSLIVFLRSAIAVLHGLLEVADALPKTLPELGELPGAEEDHHDRQDEQKFGKTEIGHVRLLRSSFRSNDTPVRRTARNRVAQEARNRTSGKYGLD